MEYVEDIKNKIDNGELDENELNITKNEVNIMMDILVHDVESKMFPELVPVALANLAQFRNRNSLLYTFQTYTLEEMLDEYRAFKKMLPPEEQESEGEGGKSKDKKDGEKEKSTGKSASKDGMGTPKETDDKSSDKTTDKPADEPADEKEKTTEHKAGSGAGGESDDDKMNIDAPEETEKTLPDEHDKTDWSKLEDIDSKEFIDEYETREYIDEINKLKRTKIRLANLTKMLNGLVTTKINRTYSLPSYTMGAMDKSLFFKGKQKLKASLYFCFDASGSMSGSLKLFKQIITQAVPQAMNSPCDWFTWEYYHGTYKDMLDVYASSGFDDDGDRVLELCYKAEQQGYTPIGVTDGGGGLYFSRISAEDIKKLKRTIIVTNSSYWADRVRKINRNIQIIDISK
jgi:hypothetical protein